MDVRGLNEDANFFVNYGVCQIHTGTLREDRWKRKETEKYLDIRDENMMPFFFYQFEQYVFSALFVAMILSRGHRVVLEVQELA